MTTAEKTNETVQEHEKPDKIKILLDGLARGECKGVKNGTVYKIAEYAQKKGLI